MVSVGNRDHITNYTFNRLYKWVSKYNYSCVLLKEDINYLDRTPHFNKLIVHKKFSLFDRYVIVDDDILISFSAPPIENVPQGFVGLCPDSVQNNTENEIVKWTANTGFIISDIHGMEFLKQAYEKGIYPFFCGDGTKKGIWSPFDQAISNIVLFENNRIFKLDPRWNTQIVIEFYTQNKGWEYWKTNKLYRLYFYLSLLLPFTKSRKKLNSVYGLHMTMALYPRFFNLLIN